MKGWHLVLVAAVTLVLVGIWTGDGRWALSGLVIAAALGVGAAGSVIAADVRQAVTCPPPSGGGQDHARGDS